MPLRTACSTCSTARSGTLTRSETTYAPTWSSGYWTRVHRPAGSRETRSAATTRTCGPPWNTAGPATCWPSPAAIPSSRTPGSSRRRPWPRGSRSRRGSGCQPERARRRAVRRLGTGRGSRPGWSARTVVPAGLPQPRNARHAFVAVTAAAEGRDRPNPDGLIPLTGNEIQHLFAALVSPIHELAQPCTGHTGDASIKPAHASVITAGKPPPSRKDRDLRWSTRQKPVRR